MFTVQGATFIPLYFPFDKCGLALLPVQAFSLVFQQAFDAGPQNCVWSIA